MEIKDIFRPLMKWWWLLAAAVVIAAVSSYLVVGRQAPMYQTRTTLVVGRAVYESNPTSGDFWLNQQLANFYVDIVQREPVRQAVKQILNLDWLPEYNARLLPNSQLIEIVVIDTIPRRAQAVANALAQELLRQTPTGSQQGQDHQSFIEEQLSQLEADITQTQTEIADQQARLAELFSARQLADTQADITALEAKLSSLQSNYAALLANSQQGAVNSLTVIEQAGLPLRPVGPNRLLTVVLSAAVALAIAIAAAYLLEFLDDTLRSPDDIERLFGLPVIGAVGEFNSPEVGTYVNDHPRSVIAEAFRSLRTDLEFTAVDRPLETIFVSSAGMGAGKTSIAVNLASVIAQSGKKVVLVDADLRKPSVHHAMGIQNKAGLTQVFREGGEIFQASFYTEKGGFYVIPSGDLPPNPAELLSSRRMDEILAGLKQATDVVIIDGPPFVVTDAAILAAKVDGVIMVVRYGYTRRGPALKSLQHLERAGAHILGVVLNYIPRSAEGYGNDYRYYRGYYTSDDEVGSTRARLDGKLRWPWLRKNREKPAKLGDGEERL